MIKLKLNIQIEQVIFYVLHLSLSQLDNAGMRLMEQQQFREMKQREKEHLLRQLVANTSKSITEARATHTDESEPTVSAGVTNYDLAAQDEGVPTETAGSSPVNAEIHQHLDILTPAQQQVNIAFPGALSSPQGSGVGNPTEGGTASFVPAQTGASSSSQGPAQEEEEESPVVTQAKQRFRSQSEPPETEVEPRGSRGGRRPGAGRPPGRGRGSGGRT